MVFNKAGIMPKKHKQSLYHNEKLSVFSWNMGKKLWQWYNLEYALKRAVMAMTRF